eukprot:2218886-Prorocentrum_lima.AAC.1
MQTKTGGYDPKANGRAERYVGIVKRKATSYLIHAGMSLILCLYWAAGQAAYLYRMQVLEMSLPPEDAPHFWKQGADCKAFKR